MEILKSLKQKLNNWATAERKSYNLTDLFDTSDMTEQEILNFLYNEENQEACRMLCNETQCYIVSEILYSDNNQEFFCNDRIYENNLSFYRLLVKCICAYSLIEVKINSGGNFRAVNITQDNYGDVIRSQVNRKKYYFRGQTNFSWGIVPSCFRNYNFKTKYDGEYVDNYMLYEKYFNSELINKFNETIAVKKIYNANDISYNFISYMQHSLSYSPLIDITSKPEIGLQFALSNKSNINDFSGHDASLFVFDLKKENDVINSKEATKILQSGFNVKILKGKIKPGRIMSVEDSRGVIHKLNFTTIRNIIDNLRPKFKVVKSVLNDRMRYQHGKFILFYDYVLVNNRILFTLNPDLNVTQYKIFKISKNWLYKQLNQLFPYYNMDYLMNPYDYFNK